MSKLLNKPFKTFTLYALVILLCSIPAYLYVIDKIWLEELDEHNHLVKVQIQNGLHKIKALNDDLEITLDTWNEIQPSVKLIRVKHPLLMKDSSYITGAWNPYEQETDRFRVLSTYVQSSGKVYNLIVSTNIEEVDETLVAITTVTILFFILLIIGFILLNRRIAKKIWRPFQKTLDRIKEFDLSINSSVVFEETAIEEFDLLNKVLTQLIERNVAVFDQQKQFIENASHELQTPLAILKSKVDLLLQDKQLTESQSEIILRISENLSRVTRINKNLLLLAKIENEQFTIRETVVVSEVLQELERLLSDYALHKEMTIRIESDGYSVNANKTLIEILFNNLLINAVFHGKNGDEIRLVSQNGLVSCSNPGDVKLNKNELFKRFAVSSSETTRSGLGLAIAKEICQKHGWELSYQYTGNRHCFSVRF